MARTTCEGTVTQIKTEIKISKCKQSITVSTKTLELTSFVNKYPDCRLMNHLPQVSFLSKLSLEGIQHFDRQREDDGGVEV